MTCEHCQTTDNNTLYRHPITHKRYCLDCWHRAKPAGPTPIDRCSDAVKLAATQGEAWRPASGATPIRSIVTQIIDGAVVKSCDTCKRLVDHCKCQSLTAAAPPMSEIDRAIAEASAALVVVPPKPVHRPELNKCGLCEQYSNDGAWLDSKLYWCGTCLADMEEGEGGMKTKHIKLKLRGSEKAIAFFHYVCGQIDNDWPWRGKKAEAAPCAKCGGLLYVAGILEAEEIRTIAQQAGVSKCKIPYFGDVANCFGR